MAAAHQEVGPGPGSLGSTAPAGQGSVEVLGAQIPVQELPQILYGTRFLPDYPQGMLKMGRFRGTKITGGILDNKQEHLHAFAIIREGMAFLDRTLPLAARFPEGEIFREDRLPVPADALREILLQAGAVFVTFRAAIGADAQLSDAEAGLSARARKILAILRRQGPLGSSALLRELGESISQRALQGELGRLRKAGMITSSGKGRATTYQVS